MSLPSPRLLLEAALAENFADVATHSAYADCLIEEGDPRGEYIQLRLAIENRDQPANLLREWTERASKLYQTHERDWLGPLAPFLLGRARTTVDPVAPNIEFAFTRGWLTHLDVQDVRDAFTMVLAEAPEARLLQSLHLRNTALPNNRGPLDPLLSSPNLRCLKRFGLGDAEANLSIADGRYAAALVTQMPQLQELELRAAGVNERELFGMHLPHLQFLHVEYLRESPLEVLAHNRAFAKLRRLFLSNQLGFEMPQSPEAAEVTLEQIQTLLHAKHFTQLTDLTLRLGTFGDTGCTLLVRSGLLRQLTRLDLRFSGITDAGAEVLARSPDITHLQWLDVGGNRLTLVGASALQETEVNVRWDSQWGDFLTPMPDDDGDVIV